jgi:CRISPR-associated protein (TIGR03986 family)
MAFTSPYNFVPLNKDVYIPAWHNKVSHDIPFEDGEDGYIEVTWENVSPLFIRVKKEDIYSIHVVQPDGKRLYFIPGSSMKGMLRSVLSILSFGKMIDYNNSYFGHRDFNRESYREKMKEVRYGWLRKEEDSFYLRPCIDKAQEIYISEVKKLFGEEYEKGKSAWERNKYIGNNSFPKIDCDGIKYRIFATGRMQKKNRELLIPVNTEGQIKLDDKTIESFFTVYAPTPDFDKYKEMLEEGKEIPVSFIYGVNGTTVEAIGMGRMFRYPYKQSIADLVEKGKPEEQYAGEHDLCETIFGWTDKQSSMKGRVQICNAFAEKAIADDELLDEINGVLGQPKASYYPLYLQQDVAPYKTYDSIDAQISGRKRYRIHKGATTTSLPEGNGNENTTNSMRPIKAGQKFTMRINVHNLRKVEIGALLSAITFHRTPNVYHNIGAAKPFGYGKLKCIEIKLHGLKCEEGDYLRAFENEMDSFTVNTQNGKWISSQPIKSLVAIASEHADAEARMMDLDEYKYYKSNNHFSRLHDVSNGLPSAFNRKDVFKEQHAGEYAQIEALCNNNEFEKAKPILEKLIERLELEHISADDENKLLSEIEEKIKAKEEQEAKSAEKLRELEIEDRLQRGFASVLNERYSAGPKFGQFKVMDWRTCLQKTERWLRDKNEDSLNAEEQDALAKTIERLKNSPTKNEKGSWERFDSSIWRAISELLSEERAKQLFNNDQNARS